jgi:L-arabinose transport system substrate-binding protein
LAAQSAQGFVICSPDVHLGPVIKARAEQYALKVFSVDDRLIDADGSFMDIPFMGFSAYDTGFSVGIALHKEFTDREWLLEHTAVLAVTFDELETAKYTIDGTTDALLQLGFPAEKIFRVSEETTDIAGAFEAANAILSEHQEVQRWLVCSFNDEGVLGAVRALEFMDFNADTIVAIGIGTGTGLSEFEEARPTGYFANFLVTPYRHGYEATEWLYKWIKSGQEPPKEIFTTGQFVTRENYQDILTDLGLNP